MAIIGKLTLIDEDQADSQTMELDAPEIDSIVESLRDCGYPALVRRFERALALYPADSALRLTGTVRRSGGGQIIFDLDPPNQPYPHPKTPATLVGEPDRRGPIT